jgi:hypothetical protein
MHTLHTRARRIVPARIDPLGKIAAIDATKTLKISPTVAEPP